MAKRNTNTRTINVTTENKFNKAGSFLMRKIAWHRKRMETTTDDKGNTIHTPSAGQIKWNTEQIALHMGRIEKLQQAEQGKRVTHDEYVRAILLPRMIEQADKAATKAATKAAPKVRRTSKVSAPDPAIAILQDQIAALTLAIANMTGAPDLVKARGFAKADARDHAISRTGARTARKASASKVSTSKVSTSKARVSKASASK